MDEISYEFARDLGIKVPSHNNLNTIKMRREDILKYVELSSIKIGHDNWLFSIKKCLMRFFAMKGM